MLSAENLASIESEGRRLGAFARRDPGRPVPQYPEWALTDLAAHTGSIHARTAAVVTDLPMERVPAPRSPEGADVLDWYEGNLDTLLAALTEADPDSPCWGLVEGWNVGLWERRMVVETGLHRWDAAAAFGEEDRLTDRVAESALDEVSLLWLPRLGDVRPLELRATDLGLSWSFGDRPDQTVEGTASDIFLRLMTRPSPVVLPEDWATAVDGLAPPQKREGRRSPQQMERL